MGIGNRIAGWALALLGTLSCGLASAGADLQGASRQEGPLPLWTLRDGRVLAEIPASLDGKSATACALALDGDWDDWIYLDQAARCRDVWFRDEGEQATLSWALGGNISLRVEGRTPEGSALVDAGRIAWADWTGLVEERGAHAIESVSLAGARASGPETRLAYWATFGIGRERRALLVRLAFVSRERWPLKPRAASVRVGTFIGAERGRGRLSAPYPWPVMRWNLAPRDGQATRPIRAILSATIPSGRREAIRQGVLAWSGAFEKAGIRGAIVVSEGNGTVDEALEEGALIVRWNSREGSATAVARVAASDATGESFASAITLSEAFAEDGRKAGLLARPGASEAELELSSNEALRQTAMHETGHALGLEHNFRASAAYSIEEALRPGAMSLSASVMDYLPAAIPAGGGKWIEATMPAPGPYDEWAIEYAYRPFPDEAAEREGLAAIEARADADPRLAFGSHGSSEGHSAFDSLTVADDFSNEPVGAFRLYLDAAKSVSRKSGISAMREGLSGMRSGTEALSRILAAGAKSPKGSESRRGALEALAAALREDGVEAAGPWMLLGDDGKMTVAALVEAALSPKVARVAPYLESDGLSYAEILRTIREAVWGGTIDGKAPGELRALALRAHARYLSALLSDPNLPAAAKRAAREEALAVASAVGGLQSPESAAIAKSSAKALLEKAASLASVSK